MSSESERTMGARERAEWAESAFADFANLGPLAIIEELDPEVEVHTDGSLANAGTFRGVPGYRRWIERWLEAWEDFEITPEMIEPVGDRHVVVTCRQIAYGKSSGVPVEMRVTFMFETEEGRIVRFHIYGDRRDALAVARSGEGEAPPGIDRNAAD